MTAPPPGWLPAGLANYLETGIVTVDGWLWPTAAAIIARLLIDQTTAGLRGDVCEIGVHHGRLFLLLANATCAGEQGVAVDVFAEQEKNVDNSGGGDRGAFERHLASFAAHADVTIIQASSLDLAQRGFLDRRFRFISIHGGHTAAITLNDLHLAERTLIPGGLAALDDIMNTDWTGVVTGFAAYMAGGGTLTPFAMAPNKLLLATDAATAALNRDTLRRHFPLALSKAGVEFLGGTIDTYAEHAFYNRENHANLRQQIDDLGRKHEALAAELQAAHAARDQMAAALAAALDDQATASGAHIAAQAELAALYSSTSWRLTAPLRAVRSRLPGG